MTSYLARISLVARGTECLSEPYWGYSAAVIGVGSLQVPHESPILQVSTFGVLLCMLVTLRLHRLLNDQDACNGGALRDLSRRASRLVYLILYAVLLLRLLQRMVSVNWSSEVALSWSESFQTAPLDAMMKCGEGFRGHLLCGVIALVLIRALSSYQLIKRSSPLTPPKPAVQS